MNEVNEYHLKAEYEYNIQYGEYEYDDYDYELERLSISRFKRYRLDRSYIKEIFSPEKTTINWKQGL